MGFLSLVDMYPLTWNTYSEAKKARFLAKMPGHGLVTGVVSSSAGHLLCAFDQFDTNTMWNIRLNPFRLSKSNINDNGERREYQARRLDVVGGHVVGGAGHPTTINYSRAVVQILAQNVHLVNVDNKVLRSQLEAMDIPQADLIKLGAPEEEVIKIAEKLRHM